MVKILFRILDGLLFSNIFIALCAIAQGALTYLLLDAQINVYLLVFLGCSTLFLYNLSMLLSRPLNPERSPFRRVRWIFNHYNWIAGLSALALVALLPLTLHLHWRTIVTFALTGLLALSYNLPFLQFNGSKAGLRAIPGAKLFIIAAVWALSCVYVPIVDLQSNGFDVPASASVILLIKRFMFVVAITIPFDIRDLFQDQQYQLKTIPVLLGEKGALIFCQILLGAYITLLFIFSNPIYYYTWALALVTLLTGWVIFKSRWQRNEYYYFLFLDGTLLLQFLVTGSVKNYFFE